MAQTVLVADDNLTIQRMASGILTAEGLSVVTVSNGVAAIKKLPSAKPLVIVADVSMPGKDGYEVCDFVKKSQDFGHVAVLLAISDLEPYDEQRGANVGVDGIIKKPFDRVELVSAVTKFLPQVEAPQSQAGTVIKARQLEYGVADQAIPGFPEAGRPPDLAVEDERCGGARPFAPAKSEAPDLASLAEGIAFAEPDPAGLGRKLEEDLLFSDEPGLPGLGPELEENLPSFEESAPKENPKSSEKLVSGMRALPITTAEPEELSSGGGDAEPAEGVPVAAEPAAGSQPAAKASQKENPKSDASSMALDGSLVYAIVHKVVTKMSPPSLSLQVIGEIAKRLADEVAAELSASKNSDQ